MTRPPSASRSGSVVTPGNHDGVHLGHRALLSAARTRAAQMATTPAVVALTFDPHPASVIAPERAPVPLTTLPRRVELLRAAGADAVEVQKFDAVFATTEPEDFIERTLVDSLGARSVVVGPDFRFGADRRGDATLLAQEGARHSPSFDVVEVAPVELQGAPVSSTRIRSLMREGEVAAAARLLGRVHEAHGKVVVGQKRGRQLGFPTANLECEATLLPADGVYAVIVRTLLDGRDDVLRGVANLGVRPTLAAGRSVEVHLFDFDGDLYGTSLRVGFVTRIRAERKFGSIEELRSQIARDTEESSAKLNADDEALWSAI